MILLCYLKVLIKLIDFWLVFFFWNLLEYVEKVYCDFLGYFFMEDFIEKNNLLRDVDDIVIFVLCINS